MDFVKQLVNTLRGCGTVCLELEEGDSTLSLARPHQAAATRTSETLSCSVPVGEGVSLKVSFEADPKQVQAIIEQLLTFVSRVASSSQRKDYQVRALAEQMTFQLEELDYLRKLAVLMELSKEQRSTWDIACELAPSLHRLLQAETLALKHTEDAKRVCWHCEGTKQEENFLDEVLAALREHPDSHRAGSLVLNNQLALGSGRVRSAIAVPIVYGTTTYGWILAVNSTCPEGFGTVEASLLRTTAQILGVHASNMALLREQREFMFKMVQALVSAIDAKDPYTCGHSARVALIARIIAEEMGLSEEECDQVYMAGLLHDVGKIGVRDSILLKPGRLTEEEFDQIKKHPAVGYRILRHLKKLSFALPGVLYHHERVDGRGYPEGLKGNEIPLIARIIAVADSFDAMASSRPYRQGMPLEKIYAILREGAGTQWDSTVVDAFFRALDDVLVVWAENLKGHVSFEEIQTWEQDASVPVTVRPPGQEPAEQQTPAAVVSVHAPGQTQ